MNQVDSLRQANSSPTCGFAPIEGASARILILGSLPSAASLKRFEYYGNPRNVFWAIMGDLFAGGRDLSYEQRCLRLTDRGIAVWDVLAQAVRPGSMDSAIDVASTMANDFPAFFARQPELDAIAFNGKSAANLYQRLVIDQVAHKSDLRTIVLPSTSPAYAAMPYQKKLEEWRVVAEFANNYRRRGT